jgi:hypothetical protein
MKIRFLFSTFGIALALAAAPAQACKVDRTATVKEFFGRDKDGDAHLSLEEYYGSTPLKFIPQIKREEHMKEIDRNGDGVDVDEFLKEKSEQKC